MIDIARRGRRGLIVIAVLVGMAAGIGGFLHWRGRANQSSAQTGAGSRQ